MMNIHEIFNMHLPAFYDILRRHLILFLIVPIAFTGCGEIQKLTGQGSDDTGSDGILTLAFLGMGGSSSSGAKNLTLVGGKQGQSVAFADYNGDGLEDKLVGVPYARYFNKTGVVLVYLNSAYGYSSDFSVLSGGRNFGWSLENIGDVDGDGISEFAVGSIHGTGPSADDPAGTGTVTIYQGGSNGQILKTLTGEMPMSKFGYSLSHGDLNGDGSPDLIVGAPFNTASSTLYQGGAVYVFPGPDFAASIPLRATSANKGLGFTVASGDVDGDTVDDLLLSASTYTSKKVLVYLGSSSSFSPALDSPDIALSSAGRAFGSSIAVIGNIDGVAGSEFAIGDYRTTVNLGGIDYAETGSIFIVKGTASGALNLDTLAASLPADPATADPLLSVITGNVSYSRFGYTILPLGDIDSDGKYDFAVSAPLADVISWTGYHYLSGHVYIFRGKDITASSTIGAANYAEGKVKDQSYGLSLALASDGKLLVGAPRSKGDTGGVDMVDPLTVESVPGGSGGASGSAGDCH